MSKATIFEYNGIQLRDCQTLRHAEQPVYASDGHTLEGMQYTLRVLGYFSGTTSNFYPMMGSDPNAGNDGADIAYTRPGAGQHYHYLHQWLQTPAKPLKYYVDCLPYNNPADPLPGAGSKHPFYLHNVEPAIELDPNAAADAGMMKPTYDINGGPRCTSLDITHTASNEVMRVEVEYTWTKPAVCIPLTNIYVDKLDPDTNLQEQIDGDPIPAAFDNTQRKYGVRSHTWTCYEQVDTNWFTTRTYNGELKISSPHTNVMDFAVLCIPPLIPGMKRESIDYRVSSDKMTLQYTIVDKEVVITPPADFTNIQINHSESAGKFGVVSTVRLDIKITGKKTASRKKMLTYALGIIDYKLHLSDLAAGKPNKYAMLIQNMDVAVSEGSHQDNSLQATVVAQKTYRDRQAVPGQPNQIPGQAGLPQWFGFVSERFMQRLKGPDLANVDDPMADSYNNQLMVDNNEDIIVPDAEGLAGVPHYRGGIPITTAFHAAIASSCTGDLSFIEAADHTTEDASRRSDIISNLRNSYTEADLIPDAPTEVVDELPSMSTPSLLSTAHNNNQYNIYFITTDYQNNAMSVSLPSSETTSTTSQTLPSAMFVRLGPAQWQKVVKVQAERYGAPPRIPDPQDLAKEPSSLGSPNNETTLKLVSFNPTTHAPQFAPDMSGLVYRTDATYVYAMNNPPARIRYGIPDTNADSLLGQGQSDVNSFYSPLLTDVAIPKTSNTSSTTQNAWQVHV